MFLVFFSPPKREHYYTGQHSDWRSGKNKVNTFSKDLPPSKDSLTKVQGPRKDWRAAAAARKRAEEEKKKRAAAAAAESEPPPPSRGFFGWLGGLIAPEPTPPPSPSASGSANGVGDAEGDVDGDAERGQGKGRGNEEDDAARARATREAQETAGAATA